MAERNEKVGRTHRVTTDELEKWISNFQTLLICQMNKGYTGQIIIRIKNGEIEHISNTEIIGLSVLDSIKVLR